MKVNTPSDEDVVNFITANAGKVDAYDISVKFDLSATESVQLVDRLIEEGKVMPSE